MFKIIFKFAEFIFLMLLLNLEYLLFTCIIDKVYILNNIVVKFICFPASMIGMGVLLCLTCIIIIHDIFSENGFFEYFSYYLHKK